MSLNDWILSLHVLSAFALVASMVLFWILVVESRSLTDVDQRIAFGRMTDVGARVIGVGFVGTIVLGLWLSLSKDDYAPWDGWISRRSSCGSSQVTPEGVREPSTRRNWSAHRTQVVRPGGAAR